jgi:hypothetical protein
MMCPDDGANDHVGGRVSLHHFRQRIEHYIEHVGYLAPACSPGLYWRATMARLMPTCR